MTKATATTKATTATDKAYLRLPDQGDLRSNVGVSFTHICPLSVPDSDFGAVGPSLFRFGRIFLSTLTLTLSTILYTYILQRICT